MNPDHIAYITVCIGIVAFLYSSVGHAGASGYIAIQHGTFRDKAYCFSVEHRGIYTIRPTMIPVRMRRDIM